MESTRGDTLFTERHSPLAETIIGGEGGLSFRPEIRCKRWGEEGSFAFRLPSLATRTPTLNRQTGVVEWLDDSTNTGLRSYGLTRGDWEHGGIEFEILLLARPAAGRMRLAFEHAGLDLFWQGPLSQVEIDRGNVRPDNVLNSIVAMHSTRGPFHFERGAADKYKTGKAFHLFRPEAVDALGNRHWVTWSLDRDASELVFVFDSWFSTATYPVSIDPTIGYTSTPGSIDNTNDYLLLNKHTAGSSGDANPGTGFVYGTADSGTELVKACSYANTASSPDGKARLSQSSNITLTTTPGSRSAAHTWTGIVSGTTYFVGVAGSFGCNIYYDNLGAPCWYVVLAAEATPPATYGTHEDTFTGTPGVYVDYTAGGGGAPSFVQTERGIRGLNRGLARVAV